MLPESVAGGFPFHSGGLGVEGVFARRCPTVRVRAGFKRRVASFRVAGVALRDIQTCFVYVSKVILCGRRNAFATFSEDALQFSWQAKHFGRVHHHFAWQAQHFRRVVLRVFCELQCQGCVKWRQGANSVAGVAFCDMC